MCEPYGCHPQPVLSGSGARKVVGVGVRIRLPELRAAFVGVVQLGPVVPLRIMTASADAERANAIGMQKLGPGTAALGTELYEPVFGVVAQEDGALRPRIGFLVPALLRQNEECQIEGCGGDYNPANDQ